MAVESTRYKPATIPANRWFRLKGTTPGGGSDEPRPHLIPKTDIGRRMIEADASGLRGGIGLCPGEITLDDGTTTLAYRFLPSMTEETAIELMTALDEMIDEIERAK